MQSYGSRSQNEVVYQGVGEVTKPSAELSSSYSGGRTLVHRVRPTFGPVYLVCTSPDRLADLPRRRLGRKVWPSRAPKSWIGGSIIQSPSMHKSMATTPCSDSGSETSRSAENRRRHFLLRSCLRSGGKPDRKEDGSRRRPASAPAAVFQFFRNQCCTSASPGKAVPQECLPDFVLIVPPAAGIWSTRVPPSNRCSAFGYHLRRACSPEVFVISSSSRSQGNPQAAVADARVARSPPGSFRGHIAVASSPSGISPGRSRRASEPQSRQSQRADSATEPQSQASQSQCNESSRPGPSPSHSARREEKERRAAAPLADLGGVRRERVLSDKSTGLQQRLQRKTTETPAGRGAQGAIWKRVVSQRALGWDRCNAILA